MDETTSVRELMKAAQAGDVTLVRDLLDQGAPAEGCDQDRRTALHLAASQGHTEVARLPIDRGADIGANCRLGGAPLHYAATGGYTPAYSHLLMHEAQSLGCIGGLLPAASGPLIRRRAAADAGVPPDDNPADASHPPGHASMVRLLLDRGANANAPDGVGGTSLSWTVTGGNAEVASILLDHMPEAGAPGCAGGLALHQAAQCAHVEVVRLLRERGVDPNERRSLSDDDWSCTPLTRAVRDRHPEVANVLRAFGARE